MSRPLRVAVWLGGTTAEREVSLVTGHAVAEALREGGHRVDEVDVRDPLQSLRDPRTEEADVVFVALHGGAGEDGRVQALLELAGRPYVGSGPAASALAMDKLWSKHLARDLGVRTADWSALPPAAGEEAVLGAARSLGYPLVVKPVDEGSAVGVVIAHEEADLREGLGALALDQGRWMLERYVAGREITLPFLEERALSVIEIRPREGFYDYRNKYTPGCTDYDCPADVADEVAHAVAREGELLYRAMRLRDMARLDFRLDAEDRAWFLEANTIPGMTGTSLLPMGAKEAGIDFPSLCERLCRAAYGRAQHREGAT